MTQTFRRTLRWSTIRQMIVAALLALIAFLLLGNAVIAAAWQLQARGAPDAPFDIPDVSNFRIVDERVWRGAAPTAASYRALAAHGVTTVVDLRAEDDVEHDLALFDELGLRLVHIRMRDGQAPTARQVDRFLDVVAESSGPTFVHCGAGVGRTGTMVASYQVAAGRRTGTDAMRDNLAVGPPSLEQLAFAARLDGGIGRPPALVVAASRLLDAPRRLWTIARD
jgi:protein tyrosine phosphatase (PTP) superfamily phosphohydrolase (DUF442 family)